MIPLVWIQHSGSLVQQRKHFVTNLITRKRTEKKNTAERDRFRDGEGKRQIRKRERKRERERRGGGGGGIGRRDGVERSCFYCTEKHLIIITLHILRNGLTDLQLKKILFVIITLHILRNGLPDLQLKKILFDADDNFIGTNSRINNTMTPRGAFVDVYNLFIAPQSNPKRTPTCRGTYQYKNRV